MSDKELEIFELSERLAKLLGDKEAIANLKKLYNKHPEMFKDMQDVFNTIREVVNEPDLIMTNPKAISDKDFIVAKQTLGFNNKKMGDIGIRNDGNKNIIYHINKQDKRNFNRFVRKAVSSEAVHSLHTPSQAWMGGNDKSSGVKTLLETTNNIIPQKESQNKDENQTNKHYKRKK
ncbi:hypothetical protein [Helicobacter sp. MIT 14-3879]|uniref:hypothetical protein n=1 Tax=Helicobacter sp. MIT 14-3879 TaxID=2040649 RepID=UPI000E1F3540|nr:hypothetical protein [Helicobacter sp. MIT 14-3879]RDU61491.1 hypothetical protein CQA44_08760 [Helicobacter sp. MIT 14-3879]